MVHILSARNRSEFLAVPGLARIDLPQGANGPEPTLLVKTNSLLLKYLVLSKKLRFVLATVSQGWVVYGIEIPDDPNRPAVVWSLLEHLSELSAFQALLQNSRCVVYLFNELALGVAWSVVDISITRLGLPEILETAVMHPETDQSAAALVSTRLDDARRYQFNAPGIYAFDFSDLEWHQDANVYVTAAGGSGLNLRLGVRA
jgi:hypothetical protein